MTKRLMFGMIALGFAACGGDSDSAGGYLGSYITQKPTGEAIECTNYYAGSLTSGQMMALKMVLNRKEPCPVKDAIGACELPISASGGTMTQNEMVYYMLYSSTGKRITDDEHDELEDGDSCGGGRLGVWKKPYTASTPAKVPEYEPKTTTKSYSCFDASKHNCGYIEITIDAPPAAVYKLVEDFIAECSKNDGEGKAGTDSCPQDNRAYECGQLSNGGRVGVIAYKTDDPVADATYASVKSACERQSGGYFNQY